MNSWTPLYNMSLARAHHTAWTPSSLPNSIVLLGGLDEAQLTAEIVPGNATFTLAHVGMGACGIPAGESYVLTGGFGHSYVTRYNIAGFVEELPPLPEDRHTHTCAALPSTGTLVIAGGYDGSDLLSSVLALAPGAEAWAPLASLPRALISARTSIVMGRLRMTGGYDGNSTRTEVLEYLPQPLNQWVNIGNIQQNRANHDVITIGPQELPCV